MTQLRLRTDASDFHLTNNGAVESLSRLDMLLTGQSTDVTVAALQHLKT